MGSFSKSIGHPFAKVIRTEKNGMPAFWTVEEKQLLALLETTERGLSTTDASRRQPKVSATGGRDDHSSGGDFSLFVSQFRSPVTLLLLAAAILSAALHASTDAVIIFSIVLISGLLGFWQERGAAGAVRRLLATVQVTASVLRDGQPTEVPLSEVVPGDILLLYAGDIIPGDSRLLTSNSLSVDEAALTGEALPVEKTVGILAPDTPLAGRTNSLFLGTHVVSGTGTAVVARVGADTEFGGISAALERRAPETEFERGVKHFGYLLSEITLILTLVIFAANTLLHRPPLDSFLFALALTVGLTPQLLPAVISVNLAQGARRMAEAHVIVRRLSSIENFGSMEVLCSDKTGTLTTGDIRFHSAVDAQGHPSEKVWLYALLNATFQAGYTNPVDHAISAAPAAGRQDMSGYAKRDELPYDFLRKRLSVVVERRDNNSPALLMVTKGAVSSVLDACTFVDLGAGQAADLAPNRNQIHQLFAELCGQGLRVLGIAYRELQPGDSVTQEEERAMTFAGFVALEDPLRPEAREVVARLRGLGVSLRMITGDNRLAAARVWREAASGEPQVLTGEELRRMSDEALVRSAGEANVFAEVEPNQKLRIVLALKRAGHVVGYMGDGINDAPALHAADVGISVANAADVAKGTADIVLLEKDLAVLERGVRAGRVTFANTLKYVFMAASANFGNMFSMAGASLLLPFLPLLPRQVLLTNLLTDLPEMTIAADAVDPELVGSPRRWDVRFIRRFMLVFGLVSSVFDYITFGVLLWLLHAGAAEFRTGWFVESVTSAALIVLVVRTRRPVYRSRPAAPLLVATLLVVLAGISLPYTAVGHVFGFVPLPPLFLCVLAGILLSYLIAAEFAKAVFYRYAGSGRLRPTDALLSPIAHAAARLGGHR